MPFNCEASQFLDIPLDSVNSDSFSIYGQDFKRNSPGYCKSMGREKNCKHVKTCKHTKGQSDCKEVFYTDNERIINRAIILKEQGGSTYPKALLWQEYKDGNGKEHHHSYVTLNNQEGK